MSKPNRRASLAQFFLGKKPETTEDEDVAADHLQMTDTSAVVEDTTPPPDAVAALPTIEEHEKQEEQEEEKEGEEPAAEEGDDRRADSDDDDPLPEGQQRPASIIFAAPVPAPTPTPEPRKSINSDVSTITPPPSVNSSAASNQAPPAAPIVAPPKQAEVVTPANFIKPIINIPPPAPTNKPVQEEKKVTPPVVNKVVPEKDLVQNLQQDLKLCEKLASEDRIGEAYFLLKNIENFINTLSSNGREQVQRMIDASVKIKELCKDSQDLRTWLEVVEDHAVWNAWNTAMGPNQDVSVYTHRDEKDGEYYLKIEGYLHCSMIQAIATILENDLHHLWMPMCTKSEVLHVANNFQRIVKTNIDFVLLKKTAATAM